MKANQRTLHRQIRSQFQGKRHIPFVATHHEVGHGRDITWTLLAKQAPEHISEAWIGTSWIVEVTARSLSHVEGNSLTRQNSGALLRFDLPERLSF